MSANAIFSQKAFVDFAKIKHALLSDRDGKAMKALGVWDEKRNLAKRSYIIIDKEGVVRFMTTPESQPLADDSPKVDRLVLSLAAKKFQERYGQTLNEDQKKLLDQYARSIVTGDTGRLTRHLDTEHQRVSESIDRARSLTEVQQDPVMAQRLSEARTKLEVLKGQQSGDVVQEMMLYQKLVAELAENV